MLSARVVSIMKMGDGETGGEPGATRGRDIVRAESSGEDPRATRGFVSNLPHPRVNTA